MLILGIYVSSSSSPAPPVINLYNLRPPLRCPAPPFGRLMPVPSAVRSLPKLHKHAKYNETPKNRSTL